jgi:hypothetical protein
MRTTKDLIDELRESAKGSLITAILVGYEKETKYVYHNSPNVLNDLNTLIEAGGEPIAICRTIKKGNTKLHCDVWPLKEYANEEWVYSYIEKWGTIWIKTAQKELGASIESFNFDRREKMTRRI